MKLGYESNTWGGVIGDATGVTSIKDLFYRANGDTLQAVREIGELGYQGVEIFDGNVVDFLDDPTPLRETLAASGLVVSGVYTGANFIFPEVLPEEMHKISKAIEAAVLFEAEHLVIGGGARRAGGTTDDDYTLLARALDEVSDLAAAKGLTAIYHPHLSTICETAEEIDKLMGRSKVAFCPDIAHIAAAGSDPTELMRRYADRMPLVHLKDYQPDPFSFTALGEGVVDVREVIRTLAEIKFDDWVVIELDAPVDPKAGAASNKSRVDELFQEFGLTYETK